MQSVLNMSSGWKLVLSRIAPRQAAKEIEQRGSIVASCLLSPDPFAFSTASGHTLSMYRRSSLDSSLDESQQAAFLSKNSFTQSIHQLNFCEAILSQVSECCRSFQIIQTLVAGNVWASVHSQIRTTSINSLFALK